MSLCLECDRVVHLPSSRREHARQMIKAKADAMTVASADGIAKVSLEWLVLVVDGAKGKAMVEVKKAAGGGGGGGGACRFCDAAIASGAGPVCEVECVCDDDDCAAKAARSCVKTLECAHACGGVRGEELCLPCLRCGECDLSADDYCTICWSECLVEAPSLQLEVSEDKSAAADRLLAHGP